MTNFERIKAMDAKELADFLANQAGTCDICTALEAEDCCSGNCENGIEAWLNSEAEKEKECEE